MIKVRLGCALSLLALGAGCLGGDTGTEVSRAHCGDRGSQTALGPDDHTPHGTPRALTMLARGEQRTELRFWTLNGDDGPPTMHVTQASIELTIELESARLVERKQRGDPDAICTPDVELDAVVRLETSDGAFAERVAGQLILKSGGGGAITGFFEATFPLADQRGSYPVGENPDLEAFQIIMHLDASEWQESAAPDWSGQVTLSFRSSPGKQYASRHVAEW